MLRPWHATLFMLIACGGKIATESTAGTGSTATPNDDEDDDVAVSSSSGYASSSGFDHGTSGKPGTLRPPVSGSSGYSTSSGYTSSSSGYSTSSSGYSTSSSGSSSSGAVPSCGEVPIGCSGTPGRVDCYVGTSPAMKCWANTKDLKQMHCVCSDGADYDVGLAADPKLLVNVWQKLCGGVCR